MKNIIIKYYIRTVYGRDLKQIQDEKIARAITKLTGTGALMPYQEEALAVLGFSFVEVLPPRA